MQVLAMCRATNQVHAGLVGATRPSQSPPSPKTGPRTAATNAAPEYHSLTFLARSGSRPGRPKFAHARPPKLASEHSSAKGRNASPHGKGLSAKQALCPRSVIAGVEVLRGRLRDSRDRHRRWVPHRQAAGAAMVYSKKLQGPTRWTPRRPATADMGEKVYLSIRTQPPPPRACPPPQPPAPGPMRNQGDLLSARGCG